MDPNPEPHEVSVRLHVLFRLKENDLAPREDLDIDENIALRKYFLTQ
jgi:hypothetical protein